MTKRCFRKEF